MRLKDDYAGGYYADATHRSISGYGEDAQARKRQFHRDGLKYFKAIGKLLEPHGFSTLDVHSNKAGIAGSGDVYAKFWHEVQQTGVLLCLLAGGINKDRADHLDILAQALTERTMRGRGKQAREGFKRGPNVWFSANLESEALAVKLLMMLRMPDAEETEAARPQTLFETGEVEYPELDILLTGHRLQAWEMLRIEVRGDPLITRPQLFRLLKGFPDVTPQQTDTGAEIVLRVHPLDVQAIHCRIQAQHNWQRQHGQIPNVRLFWNEQEVFMGTEHQTGITELDDPAAAKPYPPFETVEELAQLLMAGELRDHVAEM